MASCETLNQISLRIMVNKEKNKVLFAEAGKDFIDIVLSFLTMPLGTIARLVSKDSNVLKGVTFGSITSLYKSLEILDPNYLCTCTCKVMLLEPRNPMESHCRTLKLNIDDTQPTKYFVCGDYICEEPNTLVGTFDTQICKFGRIMLKEIGCDGFINERQSRKGYVQELTTFVVFDDLTFKSLDQCTTLGLYGNLLNEDAPQEIAVNISANEVVDLLKLSLLSNSPLTELFLQKKQTPLHLENSIAKSFCFIKQEKVDDDDNKRVKVKLTLTKTKSKILFAQVGKDFMDVLLSFLTLPLGAVEHILHGNSNVRCIDNLYNSVVELNVEDFNSKELKDMLINPRVAPQFKVKNQILPIEEVKPNFSCYIKSYSDGSENKMFLTAARELSYSSKKVSRKHRMYEKYIPVTLLDPKDPSMKGEISIGGGYAKENSKFMVTDELVIKPFSFISAVSFLNDSNGKKQDLEETIISIGVKEVMSILRASITSSSALTIGLSPFLNFKCVQEEKAM